MKYVSIDIETTGLDPETCQVLQIGAVLDDLDKPLSESLCFETLVKHPVIQGSPYALHLNSNLLEAISRGEGFAPYEAVAAFCNWLSPHGVSMFTVAGKNYAGFDRPFLKKLPGWGGLSIHHRVLDPGSLYFDPTIDTCIPSTNECMRRAGIPGSVAHTALDDALMVCKLLRFKLLGTIT